MYTNLEDINVCTEFDLFEAKVPVNFLGMVGFRHAGMDVNGLPIASHLTSQKVVQKIPVVSKSSTQIQIRGHPTIHTYLYLPISHHDDIAIHIHSPFLLHLEYSHHRNSIEHGVLVVTYIPMLHLALPWIASHELLLDIID